jgi:hypothetical protein
LHNAAFVHLEASFCLVSFEPDDLVGHAVLSQSLILVSEDGRYNAIQFRDFRTIWNVLDSSLQ